MIDDFLATLYGTFFRLVSSSCLFQNITDCDAVKQVKEELKLVQSDLKKVRKEQKRMKSHFADLVGRY